MFQDLQIESCKSLNHPVHPVYLLPTTTERFVKLDY